MNLETTGLTALVTGASRVIGYAVGQGFAREGCRERHYLVVRRKYPLVLPVTLWPK